jgi:hypothetical protein
VTKKIKTKSNRRILVEALFILPKKKIRSDAFIHVREFNIA